MASRGACPDPFFRVADPCPVTETVQPGARTLAFGNDLLCKSPTLVRRNARARGQMQANQVTATGRGLPRFAFEQSAWKDPILSLAAPRITWVSPSLLCA